MSCDKNVTSKFHVPVIPYNSILCQFAGVLLDSIIPCVYGKVTQSNAVLAVVPSVSLHWILTNHELQFIFLLHRIQQDRTVSSQPPEICSYRLRQLHSGALSVCRKGDCHPGIHRELRSGGVARGERSVTFVMSGFLEITIPYFRVALDNLSSSFISCAAQFEVQFLAPWGVLVVCLGSAKTVFLSETLVLL